MIDFAPYFKNKTLDIRRLKEYGFSEAGEAFSKDFAIIDGRYRARISIGSNGTADFRVFESESGEEYMPAHVFNSTGAVVGEIHRACEELLRDIALKCYFPDVYRCEQTRRILGSIKETIGVEPEFLWEKLPDFAALRVPGKSPWFGVLGRIPKSKLIPGSEETVEILDLKGLPEDVKRYVDTGAACPGYHMNKKHWYTLILDGSVPDEEVMRMVRESYGLVARG